MHILQTRKKLEYPISGFRAVANISDLRRCPSITASFALIPSTQCLVIDRTAAANSFADRITFIAISGLYTFSCSTPPAQPTVTATALPITCAHAMARASHCVGFTLPGIMDEPGSLAGRESSPRPQRGPDASSLRSLAILVSEHAMVLSAPETSAMASWADMPSKRLLVKTKGSPVTFWISLQMLWPKFVGLFTPVPWGRESLNKIGFWRKIWEF